MAKARWDRQAESTERNMTVLGEEGRLDLHAFTLQKLIPSGMPSAQL